MENVTANEFNIASDAFSAQPINLENGDCEMDSGARLRRNIRRPAKYAAHDTQFAKSRYVRRIRIDFSRDTSFSSACVDNEEARDMTSHGIRAVIGQWALPGQAHVAVERFMNEEVVVNNQLRVSDMQIAFKYMTARMREKSNIDVVTEADRTQLYRSLEAQLKQVELYDSEPDT